MELIDIGVNLTNKHLLRDLDGIMRRALDAGVTRMAVTGTSIESSEEAIALCRRFPARLVSTCGIHPHHASEWNDDSLERLELMSRQDCVRAIGETGLDFNRNYSPPAAQEYAFARQLELAAARGMPLFCHQRDAHERFVAMLREQRKRIPRVVVHCFTDSDAALDDYLEMDCYIGITGWICDERRGLELQQQVRRKPANRVNEPAFLPHILRAVARHRSQPEQALASQVYENTKVFFNI